ncbi:hypothetical protein JL475_20670 [Streptomyces sp. M2CJ-2]|uniref:hypothetical protein n=1 Tax=Streptomyces sp. M2CJ-2 TaxID=2803948 RepID=UPI00192665BD|nr:hypothetical protein [Streptomyces sp. M2CJ-2]MBL3668360.1 hypothetical protein [Streptomyces sp. M2CJ-2]
MSVRRRIVVGWAVLCLAGLAATSALDAEPYTDKPESPTEEPVPTGTYVVDCKATADDLEQARAEAERQRQEALNPSATPTYRGGVTAKDVWVSEECVDELEDRGLKTR